MNLHKVIDNLTEKRHRIKRNDEIITAFNKVTSAQQTLRSSRDAVDYGISLASRMEGAGRKFKINTTDTFGTMVQAREKGRKTYESRQRLSFMPRGSHSFYSCCVEFKDAANRKSLFLLFETHGDITTVETLAYTRGKVQISGICARILLNGEVDQTCAFGEPSAEEYKAYETYAANFLYLFMGLYSDQGTQKTLVKPDEKLVKNKIRRKRTPPFEYTQIKYE